jgi:hypothetical protein
MENCNNIFIGMKNIIKRILSEEIDKKTQTLLNYIQNNGLIKGSKLVGGYKNLKEILKGTDYLTRECMLKTIQDYFNQPNARNYLGLNNIGLEEIELEKGKDHLINLTGLFKQGYDVNVYEKDEFDDWHEVHSTSVQYDDMDVNKKPLLKTIHLYELIDGVMEQYEKDTSDKWY